ncbi:hypothetical protein [Nocardiopsis potens]|uniref:hypothetical protein n=1 Tax=Nocardiopsis potens TaxID=1246458 RepID=UPI001267DC8B|nr:hypothetical protein [Nocardiopsis potens]
MKELWAKIARTVPRTLWPMLVAAWLPAVPLLLLGHSLEVWKSADAVYYNGVLEPLSEPGALFLASAAVLAALGLALAPLVIGAPVLIGTAALLGRTIAVRDAWRLALRRYFTVLTWLLLLIALLSAVAAGATGLTAIGWPLWLALAFTVLPGLFALAPLMVMLPVSLAEGRGPWQGLAAAHRLERERRRVHLLFVIAACGLPVLVDTGAERLLGSRLGWGDGHPGAEAVGLLASALAMAPAVLLLCAPAVYRDRGAYTGYASGPDLGRMAAHLPPPHTGGRSWAVLPAPALAALLLLPVLVGPAVSWANPLGAPVLEGGPLASPYGDDYVIDISPRGEGALIATTQRGETAELCDPECETVAEREGRTQGGGTAVAGGGRLYTDWWEFMHDWEDTDRYGPHPDSGLYLRTCAATEKCDPDEAVRIRQYGGDHYETASAVAPFGEGLVVASHVRPYEPRGRDEEIGEDEGGLRLHVCDEPACADPRAIDPPGDVTAGGFLAGGTFLDIAVSAEGGFAVAAFDASYGALNVVSCADAECAEPEVSEIFGEHFRKEHEVGMRSRFGARIEYRPDGTPVLAYRAVRDGAVHVTDCHDAACTEFTDRAVTGPGWKRPLPGLALDSEGNPQLATFDLAEERLVLLSCLDGGCTETVRTPLAATSEEPGVSALAVDGEDRPHIVWSEGEEDRPDIFSRFSAETHYLRCAEPLCGAAQTP